MPAGASEISDEIGKPADCGGIKGSLGLTRLCYSMLAVVDARCTDLCQLANVLSTFLPSIISSFLASLGSADRGVPVVANNHVPLIIMCRRG